MSKDMTLVFDSTDGRIRAMVPAAEMLGLDERAFSAAVA
jgi:hypothetical protein